MNKFTKALLLALVVTAPVATFAPTVQAKQVTNQPPVARATTHKPKQVAQATTRKPKQEAGATTGKPHKTNVKKKPTVNQTQHTNSKKAAAEHSSLKK
jgi:hypothetical protein